MLLRIDYKASYAYETQVSLSPHVIRVFPRRDMFVRVQDLSFDCGGGADIQFRRDLFDNETAYCFFPTDTYAFDITLRATLDVTPRNALHFLLDNHGTHIPPAYSDNERVQLQTYMQSDSSFPLPAPLAPEGSRPTVETLMTMVRWMNDYLDYERRDEGPPLEPGVLLEKQKGTCRDYTALLLEALRQNGVAARLVSGYLWKGLTPNGREGDDDLHAWVEAYLPGAGWIGLDPTNGTFCDHHALAAAAGLTPDDIAPVSGVYYGHRPVPSALTTSLTFQK
jgi:transglutaminase-like putative cysteine protease